MVGATRGSGADARWWRTQVGLPRALADVCQLQVSSRKPPAGLQQPATSTGAPSAGSYAMVAWKRPGGEACGLSCVHWLPSQPQVSVRPCRVWWVTLGVRESLYPPKRMSCAGEACATTGAQRAEGAMIVWACVQSLPVHVQVSPR